MEADVSEGEPGNGSGFLEDLNALLGSGSVEDQLSEVAEELGQLEVPLVVSLGVRSDALEYVDGLLDVAVLGVEHPDHGLHLVIQPHEVHVIHDSALVHGLLNLILHALVGGLQLEQDLDVHVLHLAPQVGRWVLSATICGHSRHLSLLFVQVCWVRCLLLSWGILGLLVLLLATCWC